MRFKRLAGPPDKGGMYQVRADEFKEFARVCVVDGEYWVVSTSGVNRPLKGIEKACPHWTWYAVLPGQPKPTRDNGDARLWEFRHRARVKLWCDVYRAIMNNTCDPAGCADAAVKHFNEAFKKPGKAGEGGEA